MKCFYRLAFLQLPQSTEWVSLSLSMVMIADFPLHFHGSQLHSGEMHKNHHSIRMRAQDWPSWAKLEHSRSEALERYSGTSTDWQKSLTFFSTPEDTCHQACARVYRKYSSSMRRGCPPCHLIKPKVKRRWRGKLNQGWKWCLHYKALGWALRRLGVR